jgi:hypothetical protein
VLALVPCWPGRWAPINQALLPLLLSGSDKVALRPHALGVFVAPDQVTTTAGPLGAGSVISNDPVMAKMRFLPAFTSEWWRRLVEAQGAWPTCSPRIPVDPFPQGGRTLTCRGPCPPPQELPGTDFTHLFMIFLPFRFSGIVVPL